MNQRYSHSLISAVLLAMLLAAACSQPSTGPVDKTGTIRPFDAPLNISFTIDNESSHSLGNILILGSGGTASLRVDTTGKFDTTLSFSPTAISLGSVVSTYPAPTRIPLAGDTISVSWESSNLILVMNYDQQN